jgi:predicted Zn-dependent protease with MMP-like domain
MIVKDLCARACNSFVIMKTGRRCRAGEVAKGPLGLGWIRWTLRGAGLIRSVAVQTGEDGAKSGARPRRRDRHGRGLRGRLVPPGVPLYRSRSQQFDEIVLEAVARLEPRWETELADVEFAVQEVPDFETIDEDGMPLARIVHGSPDSSDPDNPATGPRIVLFRRPLLARAEDEDELSELIFDVVVEEFAEILGVDPEIIDPGYGDLD